MTRDLVASHSTTKIQKITHLLEAEYPEFDNEMQSIFDSSADDLLKLSDENLADRALPLLYSADARWKGAPTQTVQSIDDDNELSSDDISHLRALLTAVSATFLELETLSTEALEQRFESEMDRTRPFSGSTAAADLETWVTRASWTAAEAAALSLQIEPEFMNAATIRDYPESPLVHTFRTRFDTLTRDARGLLDTPAQFQKYALRHGFTIGDRPVSKPDSGEIHHLTRHLFEDMLLAMALRHYDLSVEPNEHAPTVSAVAKAMIKDAADLRLQLEPSEKPVRDYLNEALKRLRARSMTKARKRI